MRSQLKRLTAHELADVVRFLLTDPGASQQLAEEKRYREFSECILSAVTEVCGAEQVDYTFGCEADVCHFHVSWNEKVPEGGGVWADIDWQSDWS